MSYRIEWIWPVAALGALTLLMVPVAGAMLAVVVILLVAVAILVALVGAIVATPFLLARAVRRHRRSGRALPANTAQATVSRASLLTAAGRQAAAPHAPGALVR
jgi:hypothetical protein